MIAAQTGIAGSTKIGDNCVIAGQVGIGGHLNIANGTKIGGKAGVTKSVRKEGTSINGNPAFDIGDFLKSMSVFRKLPTLEKKILQLEEKITNLPN